MSLLFNFLANYNPAGTISVNGIPSQEYVSQILSLKFNIVSSSITSNEAIESPVFGLNIIPSGIIGQEAISQAILNLKLEALYIASSENISDAHVKPTISSSGIATEEEVNNASFYLKINPSSLLSQESAESPNVELELQVLSSIESQENTSNVTSKLTISTSSIGTQENASNIDVISSSINPLSIGSSENIPSTLWIGIPEIQDVLAESIASSESFGNPIVTFKVESKTSDGGGGYIPQKTKQKRVDESEWNWKRELDIYANSIPSEDSFGIPSLVQKPIAITIESSSIESYEYVSNADITKNILIDDDEILLLLLAA